MISFAISDEEKRERPYWRALLSDGRQVFQHDFTNGESTNSWKELKEFVESEGLNIDGVWLVFRDHSEEIGVGKKGYFLIYSILADLMSDFTRHFYVFGTLEDDGMVHTRKWMLPELLSLEEDVRSTTSGGMAEGLIVNGSRSEHGN
jgi:hypothetical protein